eukprot:TRINITY_DN1084_c0_g1_i1.p1 TRINITY_DN1084_c0_g1~~TRINITY_DN1084_c0_g1_i1.p1  ORF type:complete len:284 (-),score=50.52 TRINITY_DN1084_c0_g1_i1:128-979(-)
MASEDDIIQIVNGFLLNAPPGEFMEVVTDVRGLLKNDALLNETAPSTFREYNTEQMIKVASPTGKHQVLITKYGELGNGEYLDPHGKQVLTFDHIKGEVTSHRALNSGDLNQDVEPYRKAFESEAFKYQAEHYENGATTVYGSKNSDGSFKVITCISSSIFNPQNYWNGRWRSVWTATFSGSGECELNGVIRINVHYYEDGNVQLNTNFNKTKKVPGGDPSKLSAAVFKTIASLEAEFHSALEKSYRKMGETTFKALRRALPVTRAKIDWNKISSYKLAADMK